MFHVGPLIVGHGSSSLPRDLRHGFSDSVVGSAAAVIATKSAANVLGTRVGVLVEKCFAGHDESRGTKTALRPVVFDECLLERIQLAILHQRFDRRDLLPLRFNRKNGAGVDGLVVEQHCAGSALALVTYTLGACDVE